MPTTVDKAIAELAEKGKKRLIGATLYGQPLDPDNIDHVRAVLQVQMSQLESVRLTDKKLRSLAG